MEGRGYQLTSESQGNIEKRGHSKKCAQDSRLGRGTKGHQGLLPDTPEEKGWGMTSAQEKCTARTEAGSPGFLGQLPPDKPPCGTGWQLC